MGRDASEYPRKRLRFDVAIHQVHLEKGLLQGCGCKGKKKSTRRSTEKYQGGTTG